MTSIVVRPERQELLELISSGACGNFSKDEISKFTRAINSSTRYWAGFVDAELLCVLGLAPATLCSGQAYLWLHTTDAMKEHIFTFVRHSQLLVEEMLQEFPRIVGDTEIGAEKSIRWLKWLGAEFGEPNGGFVPFVIRGKNNG